jgi:hypothetical protein
LSFTNPSLVYYIIHSLPIESRVVEDETVLRMRPSVGRT